MGKTVYVHFSFRRPSHKKYGIFAVAMYGDEEGRMFLGSETRAFKLWEDQQYITAIQSYEHALYCIWENQQDMLRVGVDNVMLVTDNSTLAKWIEDNDKRPDYAVYMKRANKQYMVGGEKALKINVGLCEPRKSEKSHKFCREDLIQNIRPGGNGRKTADTTGMKSVEEYMRDNSVRVSGITKANEVELSDVFDDEDIFQ